MPLDFPSSPTNGQTYNGYVYSTSIGAWQAKPSAQSPFYTGDTPPGNPVVGDSWFNTNDGTMYVYVNDGTSSQWVEHRSEIARSQVGLVPVVPTSVNLGSGTATINSFGQVTLTGASSATINGVFTSTYLNYKLVCSLSQSAEAEIRLRYSASGVATSSNYYQGAGRAAGNVFDNYSVTNGAHHVLSLTGNGGGTNISADIYRPNLATTTGFTSLGSGLGSGYGITIFGGGNNQNTTVFDGLHIYPATGTISGNIQIFGYND